MKFVIYTQVRENYGAHDWDGTGVCPQYWKSKGGNTYVVEGLSTLQAMEFASRYLDGLRSMIEEFSDSYEECVRDWMITDDDEVICEEWEEPIVLDRVGCVWQARRVTPNGEYGYLNSAVAEKREEWSLALGGRRTALRVEYVMRNGDVVPASQVNEYLKRVA
jgi:hypothetical protein